ncbi:MAG: NAD(P)(+) transhydrogenase (Re/Si-specific) subunit beta [Candidatus Marinimicrobia bacterium]|nr:NAD(P)(+) transhydrogenase (Re/Si-specific) subunit beta [Candidatus Neomarinimicrobiota bacterium]
MIYANIFYVVAAVLFILGLKKLSHPKTARGGNTLASVGMLIAIVATLIAYGGIDWKLIAIGMIIGSIIGALFAIKVQMTQMPQMVAIFNGFGGGASALVAAADLLSNIQNLINGSPILVSGIEIHPTFYSAVVAFSIFVGTLTFTGSFIAFGKLQGFISGQPIVFTGQKVLNALIAIALVGLAVMMVIDPVNMITFFIGVVVLSAIIGITLVLPIGGADMPVVISLLNSYSGVAAAATGFVLMNNGLIIAGSLVGASGIILTNIMCKGMNRSLANVIFGAVGLVQEGASGTQQQMNIKSYSTEEAAMILDAAEKIIIVPGYGLAVAQAQHAVREVADYLQSKGKKVLYGIHPVAGRMPGHMNVLLAEANIPYDQLLDLDQINSEFEDCDVSIILGANDVVNPAARHDKSSPIYGMPIIDVDKSKTVLINKRTMNPGFAGIANELFGFDNSIMVFGDAKQMLQQLLKDLKDL